MADLPESPVYETGVYQLETTDPVMAGPDGLSNRQAQQLANRTAWSKQTIDKAIEAAGLTPSSDDLSQLATAIALPASTEQAGRVELATTEEVQAGADAERAVTPAGLSEALKVYGLALLPAGVMLPWGGLTPPQGFLECNGAELLRADYPELFGAIGEIYGTGDGSTSFNLPDFRGEFLRGWDNGRGVDPNRVLGTYQAATKIVGELGVGGSENGHTIHNIDGVFGDPVYDSFDHRFQWNGANLQNVSSGNAYWRSVRPRNISVMLVIRY